MILCHRKREIKIKESCSLNVEICCCQNIITFLTYHDRKEKYFLNTQYTTLNQERERNNIKNNRLNKYLM